MKKALITGITGFVGSHLAEWLLGQGYEVHGTVRWRSRMDNIGGIQDKIHLIEADLRDSSSMHRAVWEVKPDAIFHLAAQSFVPTSFHAPQETLTTNINGNVNLLEAVRQEKLDTVIQIAGSSEEYGLVHEDEIPIRESNPLRPMSPYAVSKVGQDVLSRQYHLSYGLNTVVTRAFNHTGPRRGEVFVCSDFAMQVARIEKGLQEPVIEHGNLEAIRDFTDVRDIVRAYELAVLKCDPGQVYNICSGSKGTFSIAQVLELLVALSTAKIQLRKDPRRMRPSDVPVLEGDASKFSEATGWEPTIPFEQTLRDILEYWRSRA